MSFEEALALRARRPRRATWPRRAASMAEHVRAMLDLKAQGSIVFDYGNNIRAEAQKAGVANAFDFPGFVPAYIRPLFCEGKGPFRWAALSGDPDDICAHRRRRARDVPATTRRSRRWIRLARERVAAPRACRRASAGSATASARRLGLVFNELVRDGPRQGADRDRPRPSRRRLGRLAQPRDRGDARRLRRGRRLADPERAAQRRRRRDLGLASTTAAASASATRSTPAWSSSPTARPRPRARLERVLTTDPGTGVMRHADAGYERAIEVARERGAMLRSARLARRRLEGPSTAQSSQRSASARLARSEAVLRGVRLPLEAVDGASVRLARSREARLIRAEAPARGDVVAAACGGLDLRQETRRAGLTFGPPLVRSSAQLRRLAHDRPR